MRCERELFYRAKQLRHNPTPEERTLWSRLRRKQLGYKFRRQHVLSPYIVDFYCREKRLVVEVDGGRHDGVDGVEYDEERDEYLEQNHGVVEVLRFDNLEVTTDLATVIETIEEALERA